MNTVKVAGENELRERLAQIKDGNNSFKCLIIEQAAGQLLHCQTLVLVLTFAATQARPKGVNYREYVDAIVGESTEVAQEALKSLTGIVRCLN